MRNNPGEGPRSSQMPRPPLGGWLQKNLAPARYMPFGPESKRSASESQPDARQAGSEQSGGWVFEEAVSPAENRAMSHRAIPPLNKGAADSQMLVVSIPDSEFGAPLWVLPTLEAPAEDSVGCEEADRGE